MGMAVKQSLVNQISRRGKLHHDREVMRSLPAADVFSFRARASASGVMDEAHSTGRPTQPGDRWGIDGVKARATSKLQKLLGKSSKNNETSTLERVTSEADYCE